MNLRQTTKRNTWESSAHFTKHKFSIVALLPAVSVVAGMQPLTAAEITRAREKGRR